MQDNRRSEEVPKKRAVTVEAEAKNVLNFFGEGTQYYRMIFASQEFLQFNIAYDKKYKKQLEKTSFYAERDKLSQNFPDQSQELTKLIIKLDRLAQILKEYKKSNEKAKKVKNNADRVNELSRKIEDIKSQINGVKNDLRKFLINNDVFRNYFYDNQHDLIRYQNAIENEWKKHEQSRKNHRTIEGILIFLEGYQSRVKNAENKQLFGLVQNVIECIQHKDVKFSEAERKLLSSPSSLSFGIFSLLIKDVSSFHLFPENLKEILFSGMNEYIKNINGIVNNIINNFIENEKKHVNDDKRYGEKVNLFISAIKTYDESAEFSLEDISLIEDALPKNILDYAEMLPENIKKILKEYEDENSFISKASYYFDNIFRSKSKAATKKPQSADEVKADSRVVSPESDLNAAIQKEIKAEIIPDVCSPNNKQAEKDLNRMELYIDKKEAVNNSTDEGEVNEMIQEKGILGIYKEYIDDEILALHFALNNHQNGLFQVSHALVGFMVVKASKEISDLDEEKSSAAVELTMYIKAATANYKIEIDKIDDRGNLYKYSIKSVHPDTKEEIYSASFEIRHDIEEKTLTYLNPRVILGETAKKLGFSEEDLNKAIEGKKKSYPIVEANKIDPEIKAELEQKVVLYKSKAEDQTQKPEIESSEVEQPVQVVPVPNEIQQFVQPDVSVAPVKKKIEILSAQPMIKIYFSPSAVSAAIDERLFPGKPGYMDMVNLCFECNDNGGNFTLKEPVVFSDAILRELSRGTSYQINGKFCSELFKVNKDGNFDLDEARKVLAEIFSDANIKDNEQIVYSLLAMVQSVENKPNNKNSTIMEGIKGSANLSHITLCDIKKDIGLLVVGDQGENEIVNLEVKDSKIFLSRAYEGKLDKVVFGSGSNENYETYQFYVRLFEDRNQVSVGSLAEMKQKAPALIKINGSTPSFQVYYQSTDGKFELKDLRNDRIDLEEIKFLNFNASTEQPICAAEGGQPMLCKEIFIQMNKSPDGSDKKEFPGSNGTKVEHTFEITNRKALTGTHFLASPMMNNDEELNALIKDQVIFGSAAAYYVNSVVITVGNKNEINRFDDKGNKEAIFTGEEAKSVFAELGINDNNKALTNAQQNKLFQMCASRIGYNQLLKKAIQLAGQDGSVEIEFDPNNVEQKKVVETFFDDVVKNSEIKKLFESQVVVRKVLSGKVLTSFDKLIVERATKPYLGPRESFGDSFPEYLNTVLDTNTSGTDLTFGDVFKNNLINTPYAIDRVFNDFPEFKDDVFVTEINAELSNIISGDDLMNEDGKISPSEVLVSLNRIYSKIYLRAFETLVDPETDRLKPAIINLLKDKFQNYYNVWKQEGYTDELIEKAIFYSYVTHMMPKFGGHLGQNDRVYSIPYRLFRTDAEKLTFKDLKQKCTDNLVSAYQLPQLVDAPSKLLSADEATRILCLRAMIDEVKSHPTTYEKNREIYEHFKDRTEKGRISFDDLLLPAFVLAANAADKSGKRDALSQTIVDNTIKDSTADLGFIDRNFGLTADKRNVARNVIRNTPLNAITKVVNEISKRLDMSLTDKDKKIKEIVSIALSRDGFNLKFTPNPKGKFAATVVEIAKERPNFIIRAFNWAFNPSAYNRDKNAVNFVNAHDLKIYSNTDTLISVKLGVDLSATVVNQAIIDEASRDLLDLGDAVRNAEQVEKRKDRYDSSDDGILKKDLPRASGGMAIK